MAVETLRPDGAGYFCEIPYQSGCSACPNHYQCVDEETPDEDSSRVIAVAPAAENYWYKDTYALENHSEGSGNIEKVRVYARCKGETTSAKLRIIIISNGDQFDGTEQSLTTNWANYCYDWALEPYYSQPWTWDDIDNLEAGIKITGGSAKKYAACTQVYVEVHYIPEPARPLVGGSLVGNNLVGKGLA